MFFAIKPNLILKVISGDSSFFNFSSFKTKEEAQLYLNKKTIDVYTDGSSYNGEGGWAYVIVNEDKNIEKSGKIKNSTNNIAEITAIYQAILNTKEDIKIYTDSKYCIGCFTVWYKNWMNNGWKTKSGYQVKNMNLIKSTLSLMKDRNITFEHVKGHSGNKYNELVDRLANEQRLK
jgi:ribonuclease HI